MTRGKVSVAAITYIEGSESSAYMTDVEKLKLGVIIFIESQNAGLNGTGFVFIFAANQCRGINPVFEFQVQQEELIRFQRKSVEICGHQNQSGAASFDHNVKLLRAIQ